MVVGSGCTPSYTYQGVRYSSPAGVIAAHERRLVDALSQFERRTQPLASRARVVIPSKSAILERGVKPGGSALVRDYYASIFYSNVQFIARAIKKRNLFDTVVVEETDAPDFQQPTPGVVTIFCRVSSDKDAGWYYTSKATVRSRLEMDFHQQDVAGLFESVIDGIEALARKE